MKKRVVIIGGGAGGFFAAINIAQLNPLTEVTILEKSNQLLSKVRVSGGGRCNVTHACFDPRELTDYYPRGKRELLGPFHHFSTADVIAWFADRGVNLHMEEDGRMFPDTNSSQTIIDCFLKEAREAGVKVFLGEEVTKISVGENFELQCKKGNIFYAESVVVAAGGSSKAKHYTFIEELGHTIEAPIPSLFTFNLPRHPSNELMGLSYEVVLRLPDTKFEEVGPLLFTHWGMSGPAILKLSSIAAPYLFKKNFQFDFEVEWISAADKFIEEQRKLAGGSKVLQARPEEMPQRLWLYLLTRAGVDPHKNWADLRGEELKELEKVLSQDRYQANGKTTFKEEFVTCGGVSLNEIDFKRMESKKCPGLYFCGEVMDIDALTGGFNFQSAWTTAYRVAEAIAVK